MLCVPIPLSIFLCTAAHRLHKSVGEMARNCRGLKKEREKIQKTIAIKNSFMGFYRTQHNIMYTYLFLLACPPDLVGMGEWVSGCGNGYTSIHMYAYDINVHVHIMVGRNNRISFSPPNWRYRRKSKGKSFIIDRLRAVGRAGRGISAAAI